MTRIDQDNRQERASGALDCATAATGEASLVDALFSLPEDAETARAALDNGLQSALARKMRSVLRRPPEAA